MKRDPSGYYHTLGIQVKGESTGHPFRGNQYTSGEAGEGDSKLDLRQPQSVYKPTRDGFLNLNSHGSYPSGEKVQVGDTVRVLPEGNQIGVISYIHHNPNIGPRGATTYAVDYGAGDPPTGPHGILNSSAEANHRHKIRGKGYERPRKTPIRIDGRRVNRDSPYRGRIMA